MRKAQPAVVASALFLTGVACLLPSLSGTSQPIDLTERISVSLETGTTEADPQAHSARKPQLVGAAYEVDVYGGMAAGTLIQEFANDSDADVEVRYLLTASGEFEFGRLELESKGRVRPLEAKLEADPETAKQASHKRVDRLARDWRGGKEVGADVLALTALERQALFERLLEPAAGIPGSEGSGAEAPSQHVRSGAFPIEAGELLRLRTMFRTALPVEGRVFRLTLPALHRPGGTPASEDGVEDDLSLRFQVTIHHPEQLPLARSSTHQILVDSVGDRTIVETVERTVSADRPFELEFAVNSEKQPTLAGYVRAEGDGRQAVEALLTPPEKPVEEAIRPKQVLFIVDTSGSMEHEQKLEQARRAVESSIEKLRPVDRFNIVEFDTEFKLMNAEPVELKSFGRERVENWLSSLHAGGGTRLLPALAATLEQPEDPERHRMIIVVTDGILKDEREALQLLRKELGEGRLFVVGTGPGMRQETLLRLAEFGRGAAAFAGQPNELEAALTELFDRFSGPLGWDLDFDWAGAEVEEILPVRLPDLYAGGAVRVVAWFRGDLPSGLRLRMSTMEGERLYDVSLPPLDPTGSLVSR